MKTNGTVQQIHQQNSINAKSTVNYTIHHLTLHAMVEIIASMNFEHLYLIYTPSHSLIKVRLQNTIRHIHGLHKQQSYNEMVGPAHQENQISLSKKIDEHTNKFGKGWSPGS